MLSKKMTHLLDTLNRYTSWLMVGVTNKASVVSINCSIGIDTISKFRQVIEQAGGKVQLPAVENNK